MFRRLIDWCVPDVSVRLAGTVVLEEPEQIAEALHPVMAEQQPESPPAA